MLSSTAPLSTTAMTDQLDLSQFMYCLLSSVQVLPAVPSSGLHVMKLPTGNMAHSQELVPEAKLGWL